ncbi:FAD-dependent oxidoreductase [Rhodococcus wratislaviensis]|uniref:Putative sarcosine oxidase n=1 Tax=Rhodococcus wratislaviensis NBRC 100605 TaxID=1219028 RepID=X0QEP3_RHOWR|nr:FAD-dependent oxidoreductase [Rhodococcus wratislaviensis]GAF50027.1 putative sarcosine oxidase [Rhodococcus wratislaviensis NBRC 100605]
MHYDIAIVGGGLTGSLTARSLAARGRSVLLLEARPLGHTEGSSHGTSRIFRRAHPVPLYADMAARAQELWRKLEYDSGTALLTITGGLDYGVDRHPRELHEAVRANGVACELLTAAAAAERFPGMRFPTEVLFHADAGHIDPGATISAALTVAEKDGADIRIGTAVESIEQRLDHISISTSDGTFTARHLVLAAGPWIPAFLSRALPDIPTPQLTVTEQNVFHFTENEAPGHWPVLVCKHQSQFFGLPSGADGGPAPALKIGRHDPGTATTPASRPGVPDPHTRHLVRAFVADWFPGLDPMPVREDTCLYTRTRNEDFLLDRRGRVTIASPCSGQGAKFAPILGELISDITLGLADTPDRFALAAHL